MAIILDGKKLSDKILSRLKKEIKKSGKKLRIAGILVGDDPASRVFLVQKEKACKRVGINFKLYKLPKQISNKVLIKRVKEISQNPRNHGVIIQLPLPKQINTQEVLNLIPPNKDIDLLSERSLNLPILSPVLKGILELFREYKIKIKGKNVVVVGKGRLVGKPVATWMKERGIRVFVVDASTPNISYLTKKADILVSGTGKPGLIAGKMVKRGVMVIDAGSVKKDKRLIGDVDFKSVFPKASFITPVPGGLGPMTVAMVIENLIVLNKTK